jgi:hypothetical protein
LRKSSGPSAAKADSPRLCCLLNELRRDSFGDTWKVVLGLGDEGVARLAWHETYNAGIRRPYSLRRLPRMCVRARIRPRSWSHRWGRSRGLFSRVWANKEVKLKHYPYCAINLSSHVIWQASSGLSESCPSIRDLPKSPFSQLAAPVPSAGKIVLENLAGFDQSAMSRHPSACCERTFRLIVLDQFKLGCWIGEVTWQKL